MRHQMKDLASSKMALHVRQMLVTFNARSSGCFLQSTIREMANKCLL